MFECIKVYQEVGYKYMLMPDHVPHIAGRRSPRNSVRLRVWLHHCVVAGDRRTAQTALGHQRSMMKWQPIIPCSARWGMFALLYLCCASKRGTRQAKRDAAGTHRHASKTPLYSPLSIKGEVSTQKHKALVKLPRLVQLGQRVHHRNRDRRQLP